MEGGEALDAESLGDSGVLGGINLGDEHGRVLGSKDLGGSGVLGGEFFAVATKEKVS